MFRTDSNYSEASGNENRFHIFGIYPSFSLEHTVGTKITYQGQNIMKTKVTVPLTVTLILICNARIARNLCAGLESLP